MGCTNKKSDKWCAKKEKKGKCSKKGIRKKCYKTCSGCGAAPACPPPGATNVDGDSFSLDSMNCKCETDGMSCVPNMAPMIAPQVYVPPPQVYLPPPVYVDPPQKVEAVADPVYTMGD